MQAVRAGLHFFHGQDATPQAEMGEHRPGGSVRAPAGNAAGNAPRIQAKAIGRPQRYIIMAPLTQTHLRARCELNVATANKESMRGGIPSF